MSLVKFVKRIINFVGDLFRDFPKDSQNAIHTGVVVVETMKKFIESDVPDIITWLIPGELDDLIKNKLREALPRILTEMKLVEQCSGLTNSDEIVSCGIKTLNQIAGDFKSDFLDALAVHISMVAADGKLTWDDAKYILKWYYDHKFKPEQTPTPSN